MAFQIALIQLLKITLKNALPKEAQGALGALGDITGWADATPSALTGSATLAVH